MYPKKDKKNIYIRPPTRLCDKFHVYWLSYAYTAGFLNSQKLEIIIHNTFSNQYLCILFASFPYSIPALIWYHYSYHVYILPSFQYAYSHNSIKNKKIKKTK